MPRVAFPSARGIPTPPPEGHTVKLRRRIAAAATAAGIALVLVLIGGLPARADGVVPYIPPGTPNPVNVLPSVLSGAKPTVSYAEYLALMTRQFAKDPRFWNAVGAINAGTASPGQITLVQNEQGRFAVPATKPQQLLKVAGNALSALSSASVGMWMGDTFSRSVLGFDDGKVCEMNNGVLSTIASFTNGVDCGAWQAELDAAYQNVDATAGNFGAQSCKTATPGDCIELVNIIPSPISGWPDARTMCFKATFSLSSTITFYTNLAATGGSWGSTTMGNSFQTETVRCNSVLGAGSTTHSRQYSCLAPASCWPLRYSVNSAGVAAQPVQTSTADPSRTMKCTITLVGGGSVSGPASAPYKETDATYPVAECPSLTEGQIPSGVQFWSSTPGKPDTKLGEQTITPEYQEFRETFPECSTGTCMLDLKGPDGVSCFAVQTGCVSWFEDPDKAEKFSCTYGGTAVALTECSLYAPTFKPQNQATGHVYGDPETGAAVNSQTALAQETGAGVWAPSVQDPSTERKCFPEGWAMLNPVEWVMKPVQCALEWAFVPRTSVVNAKLDTMKTAMNGTLPGELVAVISGWTIISPGDGCGGITVDVWFLGPPFQIMQACPGDMLAPMANLSRIFGNIGFSIYGAVAVVRHIARIFDYPGLGDK